MGVERIIMEHTEEKAIKLMKKFRDEQSLFHDFAKQCSERDKLLQRKLNKLVYLREGVPIHSVEDDLKVNELMFAMEGLIEKRLMLLVERNGFSDEDLIPDTELTKEEFEIIDRYQSNPFYWTTRRPELAEDEEEEVEKENES